MIINRAQRSGVHNRWKACTPLSNHKFDCCLGTNHTVYLAAGNRTRWSRSRCSVIYPCATSVFTALYHFDTMAFKNADPLKKSAKVETFFESICAGIFRWFPSWCRHGNGNAEKWGTIEKAMRSAISRLSCTRTNVYHWFRRN